MKCISCRNKKSVDRCGNEALKGISFCGKHAKVLKPKLWTEVNNVAEKVNLIIKVWKGYNLRKQLELAGPGVLNRKVCSNTEELYTLFEMKEIHPLDYFGFEQDGKVYGFDVRTIISCLHEKFNSTNPFNRQAFPIEARIRLRQIYGYRYRNKLSLLHEAVSNQSFEQVIRGKWLQLCQIMEENGFFSMNPNIFLSLNKIQLYVFLNMICNDMKTWASEQKYSKSKRQVYIFWIKTILNRYSQYLNISQLSISTVTTLNNILYDSVNPYPVCFIIMSALYRL
jgi:hypothetical protein